MKTLWKGIVPAAFLIVALGLAAAQGPDEETKSLPQMISSAKTAADHENIATYYDAAAKEARQRADEHTKMGQAYQNLGGALGHKLQLTEHCARLTTSGERDATEYESLAKAHGAMAEGAPR